jgi:hypothetical protein
MQVVGTDSEKMVTRWDRTLDLRIAKGPSALASIADEYIAPRKKPSRASNLLQVERAVSLKDVYFSRAPHALDMRRILRTLSRIRAELVGEFSLTTS